MSDGKGKIGNAIDRPGPLHGPSIDHGDHGWSSRALGIRDDHLVVWRGMEDPPPKLPWSGEDVEVEEYTSSPPHETKTIRMRFVGRGLVGVVRETMQPAHVPLWPRPDPGPQKEHSDQGPTVR